MNRISFVTRWKDNLVEYFSLPLHRSGLALVSNLVITSGLGIIYWALAARLYPPEVLGVNSAVISAMMFISNISQFGMVNFLIRFIPRAGRSTLRIIAYPYLISLATSVVIASIFVAGASIWSSELADIFSMPVIPTWFAATTAMWCIFALQDGVLIGLRKAIWVPVENLVYALAKIGLLFFLMETASGFGIFAAWSFPLLPVILVVNLFVFLILVPKHAEETKVDTEDHALSRIIKFVSGDYLSMIVWSVTVNLMPVIVLEKAGPVENAYFYLPWMITYSLYMVSNYLGMSLTAEAAKDPHRLIEYLKRSLAQAGILLLPVILVIVMEAPYILLLFGKSYAAEGVTLLRILAVSAIPYATTSFFISIARVRREVWKIALYLSLLCILALALTFMLLTQYGLPGVGTAWLVSQSAIALVILFNELRPMLIKDKRVDR